MDHQSHEANPEIWVAVLGWVFGVGALCLYLFGKIGFAIDAQELVRIVALMTVLTLGPLQLHRLRPSKFSALIPVDLFPLVLVAILAGAGFLLNFTKIDLSWVMIAFAIGLIVNLGRKLRKRHAGGLGVIALLAGMLVALVSSSGQLYTLLFLERSSYGDSHLDIWYHVAVTQMIQTVGLPSTGLHGAPWLAYHSGSHWFFAQLSRLSGISVLGFYLSGYLIAILPLFFQSALRLILRLAQLWGAAKPWNPASLGGIATAGFLILALTHGVPVDPSINRAVPISHYTSESYIFGLWWFFASFASAIALRHRLVFWAWLSLPLMAVLCFSKISIAAIAALCWALGWLACGGWKRPIGWVIALLHGVQFLAIAALTTPRISVSPATKWFGYWTDYIDPGLGAYYGLANYAGFLIVWALFLLVPTLRRSRHWLIYALPAAVVIAGELPGIVLYAKMGSGAFYFFDISSRLAAIWLVAAGIVAMQDRVVAGRLKAIWSESPPISRFAAALLPVGLIAYGSWNCLASLRQNCLQNLQIRSQLLAMAETRFSANELPADLNSSHRLDRWRAELATQRLAVERASATRWIERLSRLGERPRSTRTQEWIAVPRTAKAFWKLSANPKATGFYIPALTGSPALGALPLEPELRQNYGFESYPDAAAVPGREADEHLWIELARSLPHTPQRLRIIDAQGQKHHKLSQ